MSFGLVRRTGELYNRIHAFEWHQSGLSFLATGRSYVEPAETPSGLSVGRFQKPEIRRHPNTGRQSIGGELRAISA